MKSQYPSDSLVPTVILVINNMHMCLTLYIDGLYELYVFKDNTQKFS